MTLWKDVEDDLIKWSIRGVLVALVSICMWIGKNVMKIPILEEAVNQIKVDLSQTRSDIGFIRDNMVIRRK